MRLTPPSRPYTMAARHAHDEVDRGQDVSGCCRRPAGRVDGCDDGVPGWRCRCPNHHTEQRFARGTATGCRGRFHCHYMGPPTTRRFCSARGNVAASVHFGELGTHAQQTQAPHPRTPHPARRWRSRPPRRRMLPVPTVAASASTPPGTESWRRRRVTLKMRPMVVLIA